MGGGGQPTTTTQNVITQNQLPSWYVDYLTPILQAASAQSKAEYQPYTGPTVASTTPDQQSAADYIRSGVGVQYGTYLDPATQLAEQAGANNSGLAAANQYGAAQNIYGNVAGANTAGVSQPYVNSGAGYLQQSAQGSSLAAANPYLAQASGTFAQNAGDYMSPYTSAVTDQIAKLGQQNLTENLLPSISDQFVRAGQFGSAQQRDVVGRALRDTQNSILGQQAQALEQGYGTAGNLYEQDAARQAQLAGTVGGLSSTDLSRQAQAGSSLGSLGIGQAGVAGSDLSRQLAAGQGYQGIGSSLVQASQADAGTQLAASQQLGNLANTAVDTGLRQVAALDASGQEQQAQQQANYNAAYQQYQQQQAYPWQQIGNASNVIQGLPVNTSSSQASQTSAPGPSATSQLAGIGLGVAGLANSGIFKARGGAVKKKRTHSYGNVPKRGISLAMAA